MFVECEKAVHPYCPNRCSTSVFCVRSYNKLKRFSSPNSSLLAPFVIVVYLLAQAQKQLTSAIHSANTQFLLTHL